MTYSLSLRPRALAEVEAARDRYALVEHGESFVAEIETVFEAMKAMPRRFPIVYGAIHRALLRPVRGLLSHPLRERACGGAGGVAAAWRSGEVAAEVRSDAKFASSPNHRLAPHKQD